MKWTYRLIVLTTSGYASLVQLVERRSPKPDVEGSSPSGRDLNFQIRERIDERNIKCNKKLF